MKLASVGVLLISALTSGSVPAMRLIDMTAPHGGLSRPQPTAATDTWLMCFLGATLVVLRVRRTQTDALRARVAD